LLGQMGSGSARAAVSLRARSGCGQDRATRSGLSGSRWSGPGFRRRAAAAVAAISAGTLCCLLAEFRAFLDGGVSDESFPLLLRPFQQLLAQREWRLCSGHEGGTCRCTGTAALHTLMGDWAMLRHVNGSIRCSSSEFGQDPRPGLPKLCSCREGPAWPESVADGLNGTVARQLLPRVEVGPAGAGCSAEDDGAWTSCSVMSSRYDASIVPDRMLPRLPPDEQQDAALRKLDLCHHIAGPDQALRILGVYPSSIPSGLVPMKASAAPLCAVVYSPERGPTWDERAAIFCPTDPPKCLEGSCECADAAHSRVDLNLKVNVTAAGEDHSKKSCWACLPPEQMKEGEASRDAPRSTPASPAGSMTPWTQGAAAASS